MPEPLHHTTMAAIVRLAQTHGLEIVRIDGEVVILGDRVRAEKAPNGRGYLAFLPAPGGVRCVMKYYRSPVYALRAALRSAS